MKDRTKIIHEIVAKTLEIIPPDKEELNILIEDFNSRTILEVDIKLNIRKMKKEQ